MYQLSSISKTFEIFPRTQQIQKILQNTTGCHFAQNLVFGSQNDSPSPAWISPWLSVYSCLFHVLHQQSVHKNVAFSLDPVY